MTSSQRRLKKFTRDPNYAIRFPRRQITERAIQIIATIERYRLIPTSLLLRLVGGDPRNASNHLQHLYHKRLINRFCFFGPTGRPLEFNYFLDNREALELLIDRGEADPDTLDFNKVKRNREKWTPLLDASDNERERTETANQVQAQEEPSEGEKLFLRHELMISRFHGMLEMSCRKSNGQVKLLAWYQGPVLHHSVEAPKMVSRKREWQQVEGLERIAHQPDALFTIQVSGHNETRHFFYEADRGTMTTTDMIKKFRGHFHYIAKARQQREDYGIQRIRAVLTETLDTDRANALHKAAQHSLVSGPKPSELFWFTASEFFTKLIQKEVGTTVKRIKHVPYFLEHPEIIFKRIWFTPLDTADAGAIPRSLLD